MAATLMAPSSSSFSSTTPTWTDEASMADSASRSRFRLEQGRARDPFLGDRSVPARSGAAPADRPPAGVDHERPARVVGQPGPGRLERLAHGRGDRRFELQIADSRQ